MFSRRDLNLSRRLCPAPLATAELHSLDGDHNALARRPPHLGEEFAAGGARRQRGQRATEVAHVPLLTVVTIDLIAKLANSKAFRRLRNPIKPAWLKLTPRRYLPSREFLCVMT
jgi:hypothetical protein